MISILKRWRRRRGAQEPGGPAEGSGTAASAEGQRPPISRRREWLFRVTAAVAAPIVLLLLLEGALRVFGYGHPTDFFVEIEGRGTLTTNQHFGWRFFPPAIARAPVVCEISAEKPKGTYRIFVLGGSAAMGVPLPAFSFGRFLEAMLQEQYPQVRFEVVNAAMTAVNSHVVLPIARDCAARQADLFVVYMGNNEVVGPYGSGTVFRGFSGSLSAIRAGIWARSTRLGQLMSGLLGDDGPPGPWRGMEMFLGRQVAADDPRMAGIYAHFRANLEEICDVADDAGAKVVLCTVATNLKDCPPFASMHRAGLTKARLAAWQEHVDAAVAAVKGGDYAEAVEQFGKAASIDDARADLHFRLGHCHLRLGRLDEARKRYRLARDLDTLRFRADTRINEIIRDLARERAGRGVLLADVEQAVQRDKLTKWGLPGEELFYEHVHLNPAGNYVVAKAVFNTVAEALPAHVRTAGPAMAAAPTPERCFELIALTPWDALRMESRIAEMLRNPPFTNQLEHDAYLARRAKRIAEQRAALASPDAMRRAYAVYEAAIKRRGDDLLLRRGFAELLLALRHYAGAAAQWRQLLTRFPDMAEWRMQYGTALKAQGKSEEAVAEFYEAMEADPRIAPGALFNIGTARLEQGKLDEAAELFRKALALDPTQAEACNSLGAVLFQKGESRRAIECFRKAIAIDPDTLRAHSNLAFALVKAGDLPGAAKQYGEVLRIDPTNVSGRHDLALTLLRMGKAGEAVTQYRRVLQRQADHLPTILSLGRILSCSQDAALRNGPEAVRLLLPACEQTGYRDPALVDALACAYAESGRFDLAVGTARKALALAKGRGNERLTSKIAERLALFEKHKPYRTPPGEYNK